MLFNSIQFLIFVIFVFFVYWFLLRKHFRYQNLFIVFASYFFYGLWDWRFLFLIIFSTVVDYIIGLCLSNTTDTGHRKKLLWVSISVNLGLLGYFKYCNFFIENLISLSTLVGFSLEKHSLSIILPVGISFYTFQTMSYTIDVYRKKITPTKDFLAFSAFVSFFPQLVAGPIERASNLLPQFLQKREFSYGQSVLGLQQILWGFFKKIVIADNCAVYANLIFNHSESYNGSALLFGSIFFAFQIYGDFSGYSDIAIGVSRLFGFNLMRNFAFPYFSRDVAEFWRRWHISLTTWFKDYVYIPMGGSKRSLLINIRNIFCVFLISGFWHGASWNFIFWGFLNALFIMPLIILEKNRANLHIVARNNFFPNVKDFVGIVTTFSFICLSWIFFRVNSVSEIFGILAKIFSNSVLQFPNLPKKQVFVLFVLILFFMFIEWFGRERQFAIENTMSGSPRWLRWSFFAFVISICGVFMQTVQTPFIYFQF